jgi:predicted transcriptional regulator
MQRDELTEASLQGEVEEISPESAVALTVNLVRAYVANHIVPPAQLATLLEQTHRTVLSLANLKPDPIEEPVAPLAPRGEWLVCQECGKSFRSLKRHLSAQHGLSPDDYRMRWELPAAYSMTSPDSAAKRSSMARARGLGKRPSEGDGDKKDDNQQETP